MDIGVVRNKQEVLDIYDSIHKSLVKEQGLDVVIKEKLSFEEIHAENEELTNKYSIENKIKSNITFNVVAYAININGEDFSYLKSESVAKEIIEEIKKPYLQMAEQEGSKIEDIKIVEDVKIVAREIPASEIDDPDKVLELLQKGTDEEKIHVVEKGENYWTIAKNII